MKIFALYYHNTFVVAYPTREDCIAFGKQHYDGWDCTIIEKQMVNTYTSDQFSLDQLKQYFLYSPKPPLAPIIT
jgi:hypothetical protein